MKYKLIIDKKAEEEIIAIVHSPSSLTEQIENLVYQFSGADCIMGYRDDEMRKLEFQEIECIIITLTAPEVCLGIFSLSGLAFIAGGMNVIYQIERISLMLAIMLHGFVLYISYLITYLINGWLETGTTPILIFSFIFAFGYLIIWAIIYSVTKKRTERLNEILQEKQIATTLTGGLYND